MQMETAVFGGFFLPLNLLPCSEASAIAIWNLVNLLSLSLSMNKFPGRDERGGKTGRG